MRLNCTCEYPVSNSNIPKDLHATRRLLPSGWCTPQHRTSGHLGMILLKKILTMMWRWLGMSENLGGLMWIQTSTASELCLWSALRRFGGRRPVKKLDKIGVVHNLALPFFFPDASAYHKARRAGPSVHQAPVLQGTQLSIPKMWRWDSLQSVPGAKIMAQKLIRSIMINTW